MVSEEPIRLDVRNPGQKAHRDTSKSQTRHHHWDPLMPSPTKVGQVCGAEA